MNESTYGRNPITNKAPNRRQPDARHACGFALGARRRAACKEMGDRAEESFAACAAARGFLPTPPETEEQDWLEHWDRRIERMGESYLVDVKSMKSPPPIADTVWIELLNVHGRSGWLYGEADLIAFETPSSFLLVERSKLAKLVASLIGSKGVLVEKPERALHRLYKRDGRKDLITLVEFDLIKKIQFAEWPR